MTCLLGGAVLEGPCWVEAHFHPAVTCVRGEQRCHRAQARGQPAPFTQTTRRPLPHSVFRGLSPTERLRRPQKLQNGEGERPGYGGDSKDLSSECFTFLF